jgi:hemolysin activation/secretion protein
MYGLQKLIVSAAFLTLATSAMAVEVPDAGRILRESAPPPAPKQQVPAPKIVVPQQPKEAVSDGVRVKVTGFTFTGATVFSRAELSALVDGYLGKELTLAELSAAAGEITKAYRAKGYFLASAHIPPQTIKANAPIAIEIVEGVLEELRLETRPPETRTPHSLLKRYLERVATGKPANEGDISGMVMRVNEIPGITSRIILEPGKGQGAASGLLEVTEGKPYRLSFDSDNYGSSSTGYYRIGSTLELYSPLRLGDLFTLRAQTSFSGDTQTVQTGYVIPVSGSGTKIGFNYSFVTYQLGGAFKALDASGDAHDFLLSITQPLARSSKLILDLSLGGEGRLLDDRTGSAGLSNKRHTAAGQAGLSGVEMDNFLTGGSTSFAVNYTGGFVGIDDATMLNNDQQSTGFHTDGGYSKLAMSLSRTQSLYKAFSLFAGVNGQWASTNLDSSEQFSLGGPAGVRAFPVSEASADLGFVSTAELRYMVGRLGPLPGNLQVSGFVDRGYAVLHNDPIETSNTRNLTGVGFGLSFFSDDGLSVRTSLAWRTAGTALGQSEFTQPTLYFQVMQRF